MTQPVGRPSLYKSEYCERIIELGRQGWSVSEWAMDLGVCRQTLETWARQHPDFLEAFAKAKTAEQAFFEKAARENLPNNRYNTNLWIKSAQARFRNDYTERREIDQTVNNISTLDLTTLPDSDVKELERIINMLEPLEVK